MPELEPADWEIEVPVELDENEQAIVAHYAGLATEADREALTIRLESAKAQVAEIEASLAALDSPALVVEEPVEAPAVAVVEPPKEEPKTEAPKEEPKVEEKPQNAKTARGTQTKTVDDKKKDA